MQTIAAFFLFTLFSLTASVDAVAAANPTPDYWQCSNRIGGTWTFGQVPSACDVDAFGDSNYVRTTFAPVLYQDNKTASSERPRYVQEMHAVLRDAAAYYLKTRKPTVSVTEQAAWQRAIFAAATQETWWTHYRASTDGRTKMVRGDFGHGHGMMQIDDRWHFTEIQNGKGWQLTQNMTYAFELYFAAWEKAATASCVASPTDWRSRARSSYSQYNGGVSKVCRFSNPNDTWAQNDINFAQKYDQQPWVVHITDPNQAAKLNISCLMEGKEDCPPVSATPASWSNRYLQLSTGESCVFKNDALSCVTNSRDYACLSALTSIVPTNPEILAVTNSAQYAVKLNDRHQCPTVVANLKAVGKTLLLAKNINMRSTPSGTLQTTIPSGSVVQVLDWETRAAPTYDRYYKVRYQNVDGWVYAGNSSDSTSWVSGGSYASLVAKLVIQPSYRGKVVISGGINLRSTAATGAVLIAIPTNTILTIQTVQVIGETNAVYYLTSYNGKTGWIYGGQVLPNQTLTSWVVTN